VRIVERRLSIEEDGIAGYYAGPVRSEPGPGLMLIHQFTGVTDYIKIEALKFAKQGFTTIVPSLYDMLGYPSVTHIHLGREIQNKTSDAEFVGVQRQAWDWLCARPDVDAARIGVGGYCMGGRIAIHFVASEPRVRAFVGYYPTVRNEPETEMRPRHPWKAVADFKCPSIILYGANDVTTTVPIQLQGLPAFLENGQRLEWHFFPFGGHGFVDPGAQAGYFPRAAELAWPLVVDFLQRELVEAES
jgi:carboxymethylenebutenolidase